MPLRAKLVCHFSPAGGGSPARIARTIATYSRISATGLSIVCPCQPSMTGRCETPSPRRRRPSDCSSMRRRGHRHRRRRARVDRHHAGAQVDARSCGRVVGEHGERVARGDVGHVGRVVAELLGEPHARDRIAERAPHRDEASDGHGPRAYGAGDQRSRLPPGGTTHRRSASRGRALGAEVGDGRRAGAAPCSSASSRHGLRDGRDPRRRPPARGGAQLGGVRAHVLRRELAEAPIGAAGVDGPVEHVVARGHARGPQLEPGESARRRSARSVSRERRVIG